MTTTPQANLRFSGWRILAFAIITGALTGPGQTVGVSVFVDHFIEDLDLTRSAVSTAYLIGTLIAATALPAIGKTVDKRGVRFGMTVIGFVFGAALIAMAGVQGFIPLILGFVAIRMLGQGALNLVSTVAVAHWFDRKRGTAMGIFATGVSVLMSLVPIGASLVIESTSWRIAWVTLGVLIWLTVIPIARFAMIDKPADVGQVPDGAKTAAKIGPPLTTQSLTRGEAIRTRKFWVLMSSIGAIAMLATALNFHQISLLGDAGLTPTAAASMFLPQTLGAAVSGLLFGWLADRIAGKYLITGVMTMLGLALVMASNLSSNAIIVAYAIVLGSAAGAIRSVGSTLLPRWFGTAHIGSIQGVSSLLGGGASALGPFALSMLRDTTGSYDQSAFLFVVIPIAVIAFALTLRSPAVVPTDINA